MRRATRLLTAMLLAVVIAAVSHGGGHGPRDAEAQIDELQKVAAAFVSIPTPLTTAFATAQSLYKLATWSPKDKGNKVTVKLNIGPGDKNPLRVDLGMTYIVPFEMTYVFNDTMGFTEENVFAELYIVADARTVLYYKRIPETGYFNQSKNWVDDSSSGKVTGSVSLGAQSYDANLPQQKIEAIAVMYRAVHPDWQDKPSYGGRFYRQSNHYVVGRGLKPVGFREGFQSTDPTIRRAKAVLIGLQLWAGPEKDEMQVMVTNPFFVAPPEGGQLPAADNGKLKDHPDEFRNDFVAVMQYRWNYPGIKVGPPSPPWANVTVTGFDPDKGWVFTKDPTTFRLNISTGIQSTDQRAVRIAGNHTSSPHTPISSYSTNWSLLAAGTNNVEFEVPQAAGRTDLREYSWGAAFLVGANQTAVLPAPYAASDRSTGAIPPPVTPTATPPTPTPQTPTPTPTPTATVTPTETSGLLLPPGTYSVHMIYSGGKGECGYATGFDDNLSITIGSDGSIRITQPSTGDSNAGTIAADGTFGASQANPPESYIGRLSADGSGSAENRYTDSAGCTSVWQVVWGPP